MLAKIFAILIFAGMFISIILEKHQKHHITLFFASLALVFVFGIGLRSWEALKETLNVHSIIKPDFWYTHGESESKGISWSTIIFLAGMMIMVESMAKVGFFHWLCMRIAKAVHYKTNPIFITFMLVSFVLAMFIDSITVILFLAAVTIELGRLLRFNPVPMIISEIFCANLGGSATMCGDPPNIIIGTAFGYSFVQFLEHTGIIALISLVFIITYFYLIFKKDLKPISGGEPVYFAKVPDPKTAILNKKGFIASCIIFLIAVVLLVSHAKTGLTVSTIGVVVAILAVLSTFFTSGIKGLKDIFKSFDYKTLLFFTGLFVVVGGLEQTGVLELIAGLIEKISGGNIYVMLAIIIWISAVASAFIDNIPFAATMVPVIQTLSAVSGVHLDVFAWSLAMGTDVGGSATPIGASANVVGIAAAGKFGYKIGWKVYCLKCVPATVIVLGISTLIIFARYL